MEGNHIKKNNILKVLIFLGLVIVAAIAYRKGIIKPPIKQQKSIVIAKEDLGVPIETEIVSRENLTKKISYIGTLYPKETAELSFKMSGEIVELNIQEGDRIKKGQVIARLDTQAIEAKFNTIGVREELTRLNLDYLQTEERRHRELLEEGIIPQAQYDKVSHERNMAEMQLKELEVTRNELEISLQDAVLIAPMDGIVKVVNSSLGEMAAMGKPVVIIDYPRDATIKVNISENDLRNIKVGTTVLLNISDTEEPLISKVNYITPSINPMTRIGEVEIRGINTKEGLIFGSSVPAEFIVEELKDITTISERAIKQLGDSQVVYRIKEGSHSDRSRRISNSESRYLYVEEVPIETGVRLNQRVQVVQGLELDDRIANKNIDRLYDGAKVYLRDADIREGEVEQ